ncbi:acetylornithine deacetylase [Fusarium coicis]|nr:acetylornithine deacetylase [Fusarium coicis]
MKLNTIPLIAAAATAFDLGGVQLPFSHESLESSALLKLHKSLVERPSITGSEKHATDFLKAYLQDAGLTVETQAVAKNRDNVLAYYNNTRKTRVLVTSHIDTVPPFWPYERRGDEIWGRGTVDAKGSVAAQIIAVQELFGKNKVSEGDVALLFVVGEEAGGPGMGNANDLGLSWESVIFGEPTELKLARGHKGGLGFTIKANGKAGHSGYPETGSNAIDSLVRGLAALQKIEGGVAGNVIPASAFATGGVRVAGGTPESIRDLIGQAVEGSDPSLVVEFSYGIGPVPTDYDVDGFETVVLNYGTDIPRLKVSHKRYLYGPGSILEAHSAHEHLKVSDLEQAVKGYKKLIAHALDQPSEL